MSIARLQLEQVMRDEERRAQEERDALHEPLPPPRPVLRPLELRGPYDVAADRLATWWRMRRNGKKRITSSEIMNLVREVRAMGKRGDE